MLYSRIINQSLGNLVSCPIQFLVIASLFLLPIEKLYAQDYLEHPRFDELVETMKSEPNLGRARLETLFSDVTQQKSVLEAIARPAEKVLNWSEYRPIFITDQRIDGGVAFWKEHRETLLRASKKYQVPPEIIVAIIGVETRYGQHRGAYRVLDALTTLGFDYPPRSQFFYKELKQFLLLENYAGIDILTTKGSYAGAMGYGQFIPSSYRHYAVDFDNDGKIDLIDNPVDAIGSVANYFHRHGWKVNEAVASRAFLNQEMLDKKKLDSIVDIDGLKPKHKVRDFENVGLIPFTELDGKDKASAYKLVGAEGDEYWLCLNNFYVITRYNHSRLYAMAVHQLSQLIKIKMHFELGPNP